MNYKWKKKIRGEEKDISGSKLICKIEVRCTLYIGRTYMARLQGEEEPCSHGGFYSWIYSRWRREIKTVFG